MNQDLTRYQQKNWIYNFDSITIQQHNTSQDQPQQHFIPQDQPQQHFIPQAQQQQFIPYQQQHQHYANNLHNSTFRTVISRQLNRNEMNHCIQTQINDTECTRCHLFFKGNHGLAVHNGHIHKCRICKEWKDLSGNCPKAYLH